MISEEVELLNTIDRLNIVIDYIENHITEDLDINYLASIACCSSYNFQRMFMFTSDMSVAEYIRKRRLTLAGIELQQNGIRVIDVALKYRYNSPVSFARAFQVVHGITPSMVKKSDVSLKIFPRITFQVYIKEVNEVKIVEKEEMYLSGFLVESKGGDIWSKYETETEKYEQPELIDWTAYEVRFYTKNGEFVYTACRQKEKITSPYYELLTIPSITWAIFDIDHKLDQRPQFDAVNEWLQDNKDTYEQMKWDANGRLDESEFVICWYDHDNKFKNNQIMEMWIPLIKK